MTKQLTIRFVAGAILCTVPVLGTTVHAQGTITFAGWAGLSSAYYEELGLRFQVVVPPGTSGTDYIYVTVGGGDMPSNGTAFMGWFRQYNPYNYVSLSITDGSMFGLTSVWLADPTAPSPSPVSISFIGYLPGGSTVTNTFTTPGNGATTFASYTFNSDFSGGLTSVDILAPRWAMDNLVFNVPEPTTFALFGMGALALVGWRRKS